jgi:chromosome segregation ATPase
MPTSSKKGVEPSDLLNQLNRLNAAEPVQMSAEEAIAELREKIERMGPVNMMAIEQSKELEERHCFLTTQRKDLVDSIAQTNEAISKIDETTHARFREAFAAINRTSRPCSRRSSAAARPASSCSTNPIRSRAASTSSRSRPASACRA